MRKTALAILAGAGIFVAPTLSANEDLARSKNCLACHSIDNKILGPAYKEVAKKYAGQPDAVKTLADKVMKGGGGVWGSMAMPPNPQVNAEEASKLVEWILGLK
jgi:cytochrome c